jgi:tetratricopeptide (TPR) repeat protein
MKRAMRICCLVFLYAQGIFAESHRCVEKADSLLQAGAIEQAVETLKKAIDTHPESSMLFTKLGEALGRKSGADAEAGRMGEAMNGVNQSFDALEKAIELDENNVQARITYGVMGLQVPVFFGKVKPATQNLEKARNLLEANPTDSNLESRLLVYRYLGEGYRKEERIREAENVWRMLLAITQEGEQARAAEAGLAEIKKLEVKENENAGVIPQTDDIQELMKSGKTYLSARQFSNARMVFEKLMSIDEKNSEAQLYLIQAIAGDVQREYDDRVYENQDTRTHLAFDMIREMKKGVNLNPDNKKLRLQYAMTCIYMPFFVGKMDEGIVVLEAMTQDQTLPDSLLEQVLFGLGFAHMKKGAAYWAHLVQKDQNAPVTETIYQWYGERQHVPENRPAGNAAKISFHLGFMDELAPQTAVWIEDMAGQFVKTVYVSGFAGNAKEKQITLQSWGKASDFETDGTTGASIDWGSHTYYWDLTSHDGKKVKKGTYRVWLEVSWWPTFRYALTSAEIEVGKKNAKTVTKKQPFIPEFSVEYLQ